MLINSIYLYKEQHDAINQIMITLAKDIENKRDPYKLYKWDTIVFVPHEIHINFVNGLPTTVSYNNCSLGKCNYKRECIDDVEYKIGLVKKFNKFRVKEGNFILTVWKCNDQFIGDSAVAITNSNHKHDFTDYSKQILMCI